MRSPVPSSARQLGRFVVVGVSNTMLSYVAYAALVAISVPYAVAGAVGFAVGAVNGYRLNRRWTFRSADSTGARLRYLAVQLTGLGATTFLLWLFVDGGHLHRLVSYALTIPLVTVATFVANKMWAFAATASRIASPTSAGI
jgi:putative flippase GtrA